MGSRPIHRHRLVGRPTESAPILPDQSGSPVPRPTASPEAGNTRQRRSLAPAPVSADTHAGRTLPYEVVESQGAAPTPLPSQTYLGPGCRVVVTGAAGFLGSHLCQRLLALGCTVIGVDDLSTGQFENVASLQGPSFELVVQDVVAPMPIDGAIDYVFHMASHASPVDYLRKGLATLAAGSTGSWSALALAERVGARFVLASTSEVYGDPAEHPQRESYWGLVNPVGPRSVYDESKRFAEALTVAFGRERGVDVGIVRIFNTYGPRMRDDDGRVVPEFVGRALRGRPLLVTGSGLQTRSLCFVSDLIDGMVAMAAARGQVGPVNLGNPDEVTVLELARLVRELCGSTSTIRHVPGRQDDPQRRCPDVTLAQSLLGWSAGVELRAGLSMTIAAVAGRPGPQSSAKARVR